jgi:hypothetical protein
VYSHVTVRSIFNAKIQIQTIINTNIRKWISEIPMFKDTDFH